MFATDLVTANGENGIRAFGLNFVRIRWQWMRLKLERASGGGWVDSIFFHQAFVAAAMDLPVMCAA